MQRVCHPPAVACILSGRPNVGALLDLCEENYVRLARLAPDLPERAGLYRSRGPDGVELHLEINEQARFTTLLRLTYVFPTPATTGAALDPDARLRVYHDSRQVEVLDLSQTRLPLRRDYRPPALIDKWRANLFIAKWLTYCLRQGHLFGATPVARQDVESGERLSSCL